MPCATDSRFERIGAEKRRNSLFRPERTPLVIRIKPARIELAAQPRRLALGQLTRCKDCPFAKGGGIARALKMFEGLTIADRPQSRRLRGEIAARAQRSHFIEEPGREHRIETRRDARVQPRAILRHERELQDAPARAAYRAAGLRR